MHKEIITNKDKETFELAKGLANKLKGGEIITLKGDLGAGKTVFAKGLASGLGIKKTITSPTFVIMKVYPIPNSKGVKNFVHIDSYRLDSGANLNAIGAKEYFGRPDSIVIIEWPEKIINSLPKNTIDILIEHREKNKRVITIKNF
jgi:tRNA threonylcarbamoyladenosine biosynthesis protein TsaE